MWSNFVSLRAVVTAAAVGTLSVMAMPSQAAAQAPGGSYVGSCRGGYVGRDGVLHSECRTMLGTWRKTAIRVSDCRGRDIANQNGQLVCGDRRDRADNQTWPVRGRGPDKGHYDKGRYDNDRRDRDRGRSYGTLTLFSGRRYTGRSMRIGTDYTNLGTTGFNDVVSSVRIDGGGTWRLCSDKNYGGRCVNVSSSTTDLARLGLGDNISSVRRVR